MSGAKRKAAQPADFKVLKKKVGKKLKPANATSTKFEAKQVIVREQSVVAEAKSEVLTSNRGLTVEQLTPQTKHHNSRVRREAYQQIHEIAEQSYQKSFVVRQSLAASFESLAEGVNDEDAATRKAFLVLLQLLCEYQALNIQHVNTLLNFVMAALTAPGLARRLDATKVVQVLINTHYSDSVIQFAARLLPRFTDICRSVLGTTSSSLAKGGSNSAMVATSQKSGKILQTLKREKELEEKAKKLKAAEAASSAELGLVSERLLQASSAIHDLLTLDLSVEEIGENDTEQMVQAVLELFKHTCSGNHKQASHVASAALGLACRKFQMIIDVEMKDRIGLAFQGQSDPPIRYASFVCSIACRADRKSSWFSNAFQFFETNQDQFNAEDASSLLSHIQGDDASEDRVIQVLRYRLFSDLEDLDHLLSGKDNLQLLRSLVCKLNANHIVRIIADLPSTIWILSKKGEAIEDMKEPLLGLLSSGLDLLIESARVWGMNCEIPTEFWVGIARSLAPFWCGFTKQSSDVVVKGPFVTLFTTELREKIFALVSALPLSRLPAPLLKSWAVSAHSFSLEPVYVTLMLETVLIILLRDTNLATSAEPSLSFMVTCGLMSPVGSNAARCVLKRLASEMQWPISTLLGPILMKSSDQNKPSVEWLRIASALIGCCQNMEEDDGELVSQLTQEVAFVLNRIWKLDSSRVPLSIYEDLNQVLTPRDLFRVVKHDDVLRGWIEVLVNAQNSLRGEEQVPHAWRWNANSSIHGEVTRAANSNDHLASNLKLLQVD